MLFQSSNMEKWLLLVIGTMGFDNGIFLLEDNLLIGRLIFEKNSFLLSRVCSWKRTP